MHKNAVNERLLQDFLVIALPHLSVSDVDECNNEQNVCHENATCSNTDGSFSCACKRTYSGNGISCASEQLQQSLLSIPYCYIDTGKPSFQQNCSSYHSTSPNNLNKSKSKKSMCSRAFIAYFQVHMILITHLKLSN